MSCGVNALIIPKKRTMFEFSKSRHTVLRQLSVALGTKRTLVSRPPGRIYAFTP
jgi:hypothetical protein